MEKVRFEAFNVEELRVLRRDCYEAGAAFGDPGHTAAEREPLDDLAVEILGELKKKLCTKFPDFSIKTYGYSKFSRFVENLPSFRIKNNMVMIDTDK